MTRTLAMKRNDYLFPAYGRVTKTESVFVCRDRLRRFFDVPKDAKRIWVDVSDSPSKHSYHLELEWNLPHPKVRLSGHGASITWRQYAVLYELADEMKSCHISIRYAE